MRAFRPNRIKANADRRQVSANHLLIARYQPQDPLRGCGLWRIVDQLRAASVIPDLLKGRREIRLADFHGELVAVTEEQPFELVKDDQWNESRSASSILQSGMNVFSQSRLHMAPILRVVHPCGFIPSRPGSRSRGWKCIEVNHQGCQTSLVMP